MPPTAKPLTLILLLTAPLAAACPLESDELDELGLEGDDAGDPAPTTGVRGDVILRNRVALNMPVLLRPLADDAAIDCAHVAEDPGARLPTSAFADGDVVTLAPHEMVAVYPHAPGERACYAVWVESEGLGERVLFWFDGEPAIEDYALSCCDVGMGVVELIPVDGGWSLDLLGNTWLVYEPGGS